MNQQASKKLSPSPLKFQEVATERLNVKSQQKANGKTKVVRANDPRAIQGEDYRWPLSTSGIESDIREDLIVEFHER